MPASPQHYLVTGAAGFIAARVCEMLLAEGHSVVGVDNLNDYYDVRLKEWRLARLVNGPAAQRFRFHRLDIEDRAALEALFAGPRFDAVINLGARAGVRASIENPEVYRRTNVLGEENVLHCQVKYGVRKHVLASSSSVYAGCPMPFTESAALGRMLSPYAETKRQAELLAEDHHRRHGLDVTVLRYFTVFGPAGRPDMAPFRFIKWIAEGTPITLYGDGTQARDFTYVDDIARGTILALKPVGCEVINLGGGRNPVSLHTIIRWIEEALADQGRRAGDGFPLKAKIRGEPFHAADIKETWADIAKAGRMLGWKPETSPQTGFRRAVDWYLANQSWLADIKI
jgi:UDP-glucuronate 4-epimerase